MKKEINEVEELKKQIEILELKLKVKELESKLNKSYIIPYTPYIPSCPNYSDPNIVCCGDTK